MTTKKQLIKMYQQGIKDGNIGKCHTITPDHLQELRVKDTLRLVTDILKILTVSDTRAVVGDIGCGMACIATMIAKRFSDILYIGVDPVPELLELAKNNYHNGIFINAILSEVLDNGYMSNLDVMLVSGVLAHVPTVTVYESQNAKSSNKGVIQFFNHIGMLKPKALVIDFQEEGVYKGVFYSHSFDVIGNLLREIDMTVTEVSRLDNDPTVVRIAAASNF